MDDQDDIGREAFLRDDEQVPIRSLKTQHEV